MMFIMQIPDPPTDTPGSILASVIWLGGIIVLGLLATIRTLWKDNKEYQKALNILTAEYSKEQQDQLRESLKITLDATNRISESDKTMEAAMTVIHQVAASRFTGDQLAELNFYLRTLRDMLNRNPFPPTTGGP